MNTAIPSLSSLFMQNELIRELVRRELRDRHAGQALGVIWAYGHPVLLMIVYTILFAYVFPTRFSDYSGTRDFSVNVLAGILSWLMFQDLLVRAPSILVSQANLVKQIVFPTEILPLKSALASVLPFSTGIAFAIGFSMYKGTASWLVLLVPVLILFQTIAMAGVAYLLSACGVFFRDLREVVMVFCTLNLFAQPILYNPHATPTIMNTMFSLNPFSYIIWCWQDALYFGYFAHPEAWIVFPLLSLTVFIIGWMVFNNTRHLFGDAL